MAVFTSVTLDEVNAWLQKNYQVGTALEIKGISSGIENSNFFLTTQINGVQKEFVLTLFERLSKEQLPYYLELMEHLSKKGIKVPAPIRDKSHQIVGDLNGKPATIVSKLSGKSFLNPSVRHCELVGDALANMHLAGLDFQSSQANLRSIDWWKNTVPLVIPHLNPAQDQVIQSELAAQIDFFSSTEYKSLPSGPSHCDLFRDNVLFDDASGKDEIGGFFDFYFAGCDSFLFDIAVCLNDWCIDLSTGQNDALRAAALMSAYQAVRPLTSQERHLLPAMLRAGALRFWTSRLWDFHLPRDAAMLKAHDPGHFERVLRQRLVPGFALAS